MGLRPPEGRSLTEAQEMESLGKLRVTALNRAGFMRHQARHKCNGREDDRCPQKNPLQDVRFYEVCVTRSLDWHSLL